MAKQSTTGGAAETEAHYDPDAALRSMPEEKPRMDYPIPPAGKTTEEMSLEERLVRLENLAAKFFGTEHFAPPAPVFNPDAERDAARRNFQAEMERIEAAAKKPN